MSKIIVAGAGHGGLTAAIKLAGIGHEVTVYELNERENCGHDQKDSFDAQAMEFAGFDIPESFRAPGNTLTFVPLEDDVAPISLPPKDDYRNLTVDRKEFLNYLIDLAINAGVKFEFGVHILGPVVLGSRIAGINTDKGDFYGDLIIDACGVHSPLRSNLPDFTFIDKEPAYYDILHTYRAYFDRVPGIPDPENYYNLYIKEDGTTGFKWIITEKDCVDVLLIRFPEIAYPEVAEGLNTISEMNPHMGKELKRGGKFIDIPVRAPLAVLVADGYAAVGDSAFMTYAIKGSGIAYSLIAGTLLARAVSEDTDGFYTAETLWKYENKFFHEVGFNAGRIAILKNILPFLSAADVNEIFKRGLITTEDVDSFVSGDLRKTKLPAIAVEKIKILGDVPGIRSLLVNMVGWLGKYTVLESSFPEKYSREDMEKWAAKYNKFFDSIRKVDGE